MASFLLRRLEKHKSRRTGLAFAAVAISVLSWSSAFLVIAFSLKEMRPIPLATARFAIAGLIALGWLLWRRPQLPSLRHMVRFAICGLFGFTLYSVFLNTGQTYPSEVNRRIFAFARGKLAGWRSTKAKSTMLCWRCYG